MINADVWVLDRFRDLHRTLERGARASCIAVDEEANQIRNVLVGSRKPVLQSQQIRADVLRRAGDELQQPRNPPQHLHLVGAGDAGLLRAATQFLEEAAKTACGGMSREAPHARQLGGFARRHTNDHRVAGFAARLQGRHDGAQMIFHEQHCRDDNVGGGDGVIAARKSRFVLAPMSSRMHLQPKTRQVAS